MYEAIKVQNVTEARKYMRDRLLDVTKRFEELHKKEKTEERKLEQM